MNPKQLTHTSKFLSLVLRHEPETVGITLDDAGWVSVQELLDGCKSHGKPISLAELEEVVATNSKKRFAFSEDRSRIRASQGHSVGVELGYPPATPPDALYHGTHEEAVASIFKAGIHRGERHHVHLTALPTTAVAVGQRRGKPVIFKIDAAGMHRDGHTFHQSENGVWLTDNVPSQYLQLEGAKT